jgi:hypothetical protein
MHKTRLYYKLAVSDIIENYDNISRDQILQSLNKIIEDDKTGHRPKTS